MPKRTYPTVEAAIHALNRIATAKPARQEKMLARMSRRNGWNIRAAKKY
ncbi:MAG: hypothetical protein WCP11_01830 [Candidatus Saccharibacteria bacterium]